LVLKVKNNRKYISGHCKEKGKIIKGKIYPTK